MKIALPPKGGKAQRLGDRHNKIVQSAQNAKSPLYRLVGVVLWPPIADTALRLFKSPLSDHAVHV